MSGVVERLRAALGPRVRSDAAGLEAHRADAWMLSELRAFQGRPPEPPLAVVEAAGTGDVVRTLRICGEAGVPVVPFGAGSGVCGGVAPGPSAVVLSLRAMAGLRELDDVDLRARFGAGTLGIDAEHAVEAHGLTIGHWPQSVALSTVGGWVATRASGQYSTAHGNVEDLVLALEAVLPDGTVLRTRETPRAAAGPDLRHLLLGSEGTLGVVTEVTFSLRPKPEASQGQSFHFADLDTGLDVVRRILRAGWLPPVARLYDARESRRGFRDHVPRGRALLLLLHEGPGARVTVEADEVASLCLEAGGVAAGPAPVAAWLERRNHVPGFRSFLERGVVVDTIEVAATWSRIGEVYRRVTASLSEVPGILSATAHASHGYRSGTNLYFSFAVAPERPEQMADAYTECWRRTMEATLAAGGGIAHHHGIGRVRRAWLEQELGAGGVALLRALKRTLDPAGLLNPGSLLPDTQP